MLEFAACASLSNVVSVKYGTATTLGRAQSTCVELDAVHEAGVKVEVVLVVVVLVVALTTAALACANVVVFDADVELEPQAAIEQPATRSSDNFAMRNLSKRDPLRVICAVSGPRGTKT